MSRLPFELFLALRYLRPKRTFVSAITLISVIGVMLGVAVLIIVISVMSGFDRELRDRILGFNAHMHVFRQHSVFTNYAGAMNIIATDPQVAGVAPYITGPVLVKTEPMNGNAQVGAPILRGIDLEYETNVSVLHTSIVSGELNLEGSALLVGREFARSMGLAVGDRVAVYSPRTIEEFEKRGDRGVEEVVLPDDFVIRGIFDVGYHEFNDKFIVTSLENAQDLYRLLSAVHGLQVMVRDPFHVELVRARLAQQLGPGYYISVWTEESSALLDAVLVEKNVMFFLLFFIILVAAFGIVNSQITFVVQKTREIGLVKALGAARTQILALFLGQSLIVAVAGVVSGLGLGLLALAHRNEFLHWLRQSTGIEIFPAAIYGFSELPALIDPGDIALICGSALASCVLAGVIPALTAARLHPVEALRYE